MVRHGYLTPQGADAVFAAPIELNPDPDQRPILAPHFVQYVIDTLDSRLGASYTRRAGLNIITSLDLRMQEMAQQIHALTLAHEVHARRVRIALGVSAAAAVLAIVGIVLALV